MATTLLYNNKSIQSQSPTRRKDFLLNPMQLLIIPLLLLLLVGASGNSDWLQSCGVCYCNWNSGKKTADCKDRSLQVVPTDLSTELQVVDLSNNIIAELRRDQFQDANLQNLHKIFMRNCTLQELNRDALKGLAILIELDLSHNFIRILHSGTFSGLVKLRNLVMNNNEIEILDDYLFADLEFLSRVEFKHNRLKHIAVNAFGHLPMLSAVYLESNQLHVLRKETFNRTPKLLHLSLAQNPWNCTCELQQFRDYALMHRLYTPPTDCHEPKHLRGKLWSEIPSENFACRPKIIKPTIRPGMSVNSYVEATNENVTLKCHIQASPQPDILWLYNKRPLNTNDQRYMVRNSIEQNRNENTNILTSELIIYGVRSGDKGTYTCIAENRGGKDEFDIQLFVNVDRFATGGNLGPFSGIDNSGNAHDSSSNVLLIICLIATTFLLLLIIVVLVICWYCRRIKSYHKDPTMSENGLITSKIDKSHNGSLLEGSVIMEMQKSLLTEVNPVEKPPRRTEIENVDGDDGHEIKKTLLDETAFGHHQHHHHHHQHIHRDEETHSLALSDTTPRSRHTYVDDGYGTNLPPDLLSFPARVPASPSMQSSTSNIPDNVIYGKSPLSSPVYHHVTPIYGTATTMAIAAPNGFMTLQHPKSRNLALVAAANSRNQSPFMPAPVVYSPVVMKQGYMTIPRKPRVPSWTPSSSHATQLSEFQSPASPNPSETGTAHTEPMEPVYDNLGLRTTAGGNSVLNLNKVHNQEQSSLSQQSSSSSSSTKYSMKDRPLPATPNNRIDVQSTNVANAVSQQLQHHPHHIQQQQQQQQQLQQQQQHYHQQQQLQQQQQHQHQQSPPPPKQLVSLNTSTNSCTTNGHSAKLYEPINELVNNLTTTSDTEPLYGTARHHSGVIIVPSSNNNTATSLPAASSASLVMEKISKIPPRPPPKPKKKMSVTSRGQGSTSQLFDDEGEDGTEV